MTPLLALVALLHAAAPVEDHHDDPAPTVIVEEPPAAPTVIVEEPPAAPPGSLERAQARLERATRLHGALGTTLDAPTPSDGCGPGGSLVAGTLLGGGAVWAARETDLRGTWTVVLGTLAAGALTDGVIGYALGPDESCRARFRAAPSGTTEQRERAVELGRACLREEAGLERTRGWLRLGVGLATAGGAFALWGTEPPERRDPSLLAIGGVGAVLSFGALATGEAEKRWQGWLSEELAADERLRN